MFINCFTRRTRFKTGRHSVGVVDMGDTLLYWDPVIDEWFAVKI